jgi:hypothetical protein
MGPRQMPGLPLYRAIVALDIESSTTRPNPVKGELRNKAYELFEVALCTAGVDKRYRDRFIDRGDGILALIHPVDQAPKALLLNHTVPCSAGSSPSTTPAFRATASRSGNCGSASWCTRAKSTTTTTDATARPWMSPSASSMPPRSKGPSGKQPTR